MSKPNVTQYKSGDKDMIRFVSGTMAFEEGVKDGRYIGLYESPTGQVARENVMAGMPHLHPAAFPLGRFVLEVDGQSLHDRWAFEGNSVEEEAGGQVVSTTTLRHTLRPVSVRVRTRLDGTACLARWLEITNTGDAPAALSRVAPLSGILWHNNFYTPDGIAARLGHHKDCGAPFSVAYMDAYRPGDEFNLRWVDIALPELVFANRNRHIFGAPYYIARNNISGETYYIALAWPAGFETRFAYDRHNKILSFETGPQGRPPLRVIAPGETVVSPVAHLGVFHADTGAATREWHAHLRASVIPQRRGAKRAFTIGARVVEEPGDWIVREIDIAHEMGCEAFMVDAGWYGEPFSPWPKHRGDWYEGSFLPLGGLAGIRDYCHKKDMLFGVWMEPEA
ncbi:MAG: alpha-galactosidase, partial [Kiritimatiellaeota bacterium]|nr:alpha-galactosidase [Kiritimatiellota bacterium]